MGGLLGKTLMVVGSVNPELDFKPITDALATSVNITTVGQVIAAVLGASVGLAVFWFGGRKIVTAIMSAFKSGRVKF